MDIRKPKPIHGWRDFAVEIGTIALGILIALGAEQAVEAWHWRHTIAEIEAAMRLEIGHDDGPQAFERLAVSACLARQLDVLEASLIAERDHATPFTPERAYLPPLRTWDDDAWRVLIASGATTHMPIERASRWSSPYELIPGMDRQNLQEFQDTLSLGHLAIAPAHPSEVERDAILAAIQRLRGDNIFLTDASAALLRAAAVAGVTISAPRTAQYLAGVRSAYGPCVQPLGPASTAR